MVKRQDPYASRLVIFLLAFSLINFHGHHFVQAMCPEKCTCDDVNLIVTCIKAGLEVMPNTLNPRLRTITYKYNNFPTVDVSLRFLSKLVSVDLSHNHIVSISDKAFARNSDMNHLKLDGNKIGHVSNKTFYGLSNVEVISLRGNAIENLPEHLFKFAPKVQKIDLARNSINSMHAQAFQGILKDHLKILHLENNFLTSVPIEALRPLVGLAELHLSGNPIKVLPANAFVHFHSLTLLEINQCKIAEVHNLAFNGLGTLRSLKLGDNNLSEVPSEALRRVPNLHSIHLDRNPFETLASDALTPVCSQLKRLDISGCSKLTSIQSHVFQGCAGLKHVTISMNRALETIDASAFDSSMTSLHSLDLSDNSLKNVPSSLVPWLRLKSLDLSGNPWRCDCDLSFLPKILHTLSQKSNNNTDKKDANISGDNNKIIAGQCVESGQSLYDVKFECEDRIFLSRNSQIQAENAKINSESSELPGEFSNNSKDSKNSIQDEVMLRQKASNETAVIVSVSIVSIVVLLTIFMFIYLKWCKRHVQDWVKEYKWRRHDAKLAHKQSRYGVSSAAGGAMLAPNGTLMAGHPSGVAPPGANDQYQQYHPYLKGDNYIYTSPRLHHTYVYHGQSPLHSGVSPHAQQYYTQNTLVNTSVNVPNAVQKSQNTADNSTFIDNDDEYFYVSNHYNPHHDTAVSVMSNGGYATTTTAKHIPVTVL